MTWLFDDWVVDCTFMTGTEHIGSRHAIAGWGCPTLHGFRNGREKAPRHTVCTGLHTRVIAHSVALSTQLTQPKTSSETLELAQIHAVFHLEHSFTRVKESLLLSSLVGGLRSREDALFPRKRVPRASPLHLAKEPPPVS